MNILKCARTVSMAVLLAPALVRPAAGECANALPRDTNRQDVGTVSLLQTPAGVLLKLSVKGMPPGEHAFHIHAVGKCEPPSFDSAGAHINPGNTHHGIMVGPGHAGDMPNLHIPPNGSLEVELINAAITIDTANPNSVFHPRRHHGGDPRRQGRLHDRPGRKRRQPDCLRRDQLRPIMVGRTPAQ